MLQSHEIKYYTYIAIATLTATNANQVHGFSCK